MLFSEGFIRLHTRLAVADNHELLALHKPSYLSSIQGGPSSFSIPWFAFS